MRDGIEEVKYRLEHMAKGMDTVAGDALSVLLANSDDRPSAVRATAGVLIEGLLGECCPAVVFLLNTIVAAEPVDMLSALIQALKENGVSLAIMALAPNEKELIPFRSALTHMSQAHGDEYADEIASALGALEVDFADSKLGAHAAAAKQMINKGDNDFGAIAELAEALAPTRPIINILLQIVAMGETVFGWIESLVASFKSGDILTILGSVLEILPTILNAIESASDDRRSLSMIDTTVDGQIAIQNHTQLDGGLYGGGGAQSLLATTGMWSHRRRRLLDTNAVMLVVNTMVPIVVKLARGDWGVAFLDLIDYVSPMVKNATGFDPGIAVHGVHKLINEGPAEGIVYLIEGYAPPAIAAVLKVIILGGDAGDILDAVLGLLGFSECDGSAECDAGDYIGILIKAIVSTDNEAGVDPLISKQLDALILLARGTVVKASPSQDLILFPAPAPVPALDLGCSPNPSPSSASRPASYHAPPSQVRMKRPQRPSKLWGVTALLRRHCRC